MKKYVLLTLALVALTAAIGMAGTHIVGGGYNSGNTIPFWSNSTYYPQMRWHCLWRQTDINEAGYVSKIEWLAYPTTIQGGTFNGCKILLCHSTLATLTATYASNYTGNTPVTLFNGNYTAPTPSPGAWATIIEPTTTINYNNTSNLLMEVSWTSFSGGGRNDYRCMGSGGVGGRVYAASATATSGTLNATYAQYGRLTIGFVGVAPTSLGRVKSIFK
jgi:hypothetical protein